MNRYKGYERHFNKDANQYKRFIQAVLGWWRGNEKKKRYKDIPVWLKREIMAKAVAKRQMRNKKRLAQAQNGAIGMMTKKTRK